jgi:hypothetical protein
MATHNVPIPRASFGTTLVKLCFASSSTTLEYATKPKQTPTTLSIHLKNTNTNLKLGLSATSIWAWPYHSGHRPPRTPGVYIAPSFSKKPQTVFIDRSEKLSLALITELQAIIGTLLYYARAVDPTLLPIANELASQQANATRRILNAANRALSYCAAFSNNQIVYHACDMVLHAFADASYLCRSHSRSVAGAIFFLGNHNDPTRINDSIHVFSSIIPCIVASAGEAEYAALFAAGQHAASIRTTLSDMGYPQNPTIIMCDNTSAIGIATNSIKQKRSKAIDMRFHWIRDRVRQSQFTIV